jgi:serine/threonine protein kinase
LPGPELYRKAQQLGPWTDVYGVGASMFACMMGAPPQAADQRQLNDRMPELYAGLKGHYSDSLIDTVAWCLKMDPMERPQSVFALQKALRNVGGDGQGGESGGDSRAGAWRDSSTPWRDHSVGASAVSRYCRSIPEISCFHFLQTQVSSR